MALGRKLIRHLIRSLVKLEFVSFWIKIELHFSTIISDRDESSFHRITQLPDRDSLRFHKSIHSLLTYLLCTKVIFGAYYRIAYSVPLREAAS